MVDESFDTEQLKSEPKPWEYRSKPAWQRLIIILGGVTVNLILGFFIYMMILFVWGKDTLYSDSLPQGLNPSPIAKEIGFQESDNIISVDGKILDNVLDINKNLFLRDIKKVTVKRKNGSEETLIIPENIGSKMFESGELFPLTPKLDLIVGEVVNNSPAERSGLKKGDKIIAVNEIEINDFNSFTTILRERKYDSINLSVIRKNSLNLSESKEILKVFPNENGTIGFYRQNIKLGNEKLTFLTSIKEGFF